MATTTRTDSVVGALLVASLALLGLSDGGCSTHAPEPARVATTPFRPSFTSGKLLDYAPAAGLRWLVVGRPSRMAADTELARNLGLVLAPERLDAFAHVTGMRLDRLTLGAIAGYDLGTLFLAELDGPEVPVVRARFAARLVEGGVEHSRAGLHRIVGTTASGALRALVTIDDRFVAFASRDATLARVVQAYAENRLRSPTVLHGAGLRELPPLADDTLVAFFAPGPFSSEWGGAASGIVAAADAVSIQAKMAPDGRLRATLALAGNWEGNAPSALEKLELAWRDLEGSSTGHLLGLDQATGFSGKADLQHLTLVADLPVGPLARGLRDATSADVREILELEGPSEGTPP